jgi:outer membrane protein assembly factor BamE (lipoprotein component of BamABCDE complex)
MNRTYRFMIWATLGMAAGVSYAQSAVAGNSDGIGLVSERRLAEVIPGKSTKAQVESLLGKPWRVVQFNDCGHALPGQSDETWDYRGKDASGSYRVHIEFDDAGLAHLVAKIPDQVNGGKGTTAKIAPGGVMSSMKM